METDYFLNFLVLSGQKRKRETPTKNDAFRLPYILIKQPQPIRYKETAQG